MHTENIIFNSKLELNKYLDEVSIRFYEEAGGEKFFLLKMNEGIHPFTFKKEDNGYAPMINDVNWVKVYNDANLRDYIKDRFDPSSFDEMYECYKKLIRKKGLAKIDGTTAFDLPSFPCTLLGVLSESEFVDWYIKNVEVKEKAASAHMKELEVLCFEYPPDLKKTDKILSQVEDFHIFYLPYLCHDYIADNADFLSWVISEYFDRINDDYYNQKGNVRKETYITKIVELFLKHGYDLHCMFGLVGASCLDALVYSGFNEELCNVAKLLLDHGADPTIGDEDGLNILDKIESHCFCVKDNRADYTDEYFDNLNALYEFKKMCLKASEKISNNNLPVKEEWFQKLLPTLLGVKKDICNCPKCGCDGDNIRIYPNGTIISLICPKCGFRVKNANLGVYKRDNSVELLIKEWENF